MTVLDGVNRDDYSGNGIGVDFTVNFRFLDNTHIKVIHVDALNVETTWILDTDYTATGAGNPTGSITATTAPALGERLVIIRDVPFTQLKDYVENDPFPAQSHENGLDKNTMLAQQIKEENDRTLKVTAGADPNFDITLPSPVAGKVIAVWNSTATGMDIGPDAGEIAAAESHAEAAQAAAATVTSEFDTVALMVADTAIAIGNTVRTNGYLTLGDGGGNLYLVVSAATGTDDGGSFIDLVGITGQAQGLFDHEINVKQWGAIVDASADTTAHVQAAFDYVSSIGGGNIFVPVGVYRIDTKLQFRPNVSVFCEGNSWNRNIVVWDHRGPEYCFYNSEYLDIVTLELGEITHDNNSSTVETVDFVSFRRGISSCRVKVAMETGAATRHGVVLYGENPDTSNPNNTQYRNQFEILGRGATEAPGNCLYLFGKDINQTRCNANVVLEGSKFDGFETGIWTNGNGNFFNGITLNGPATTAALHFEGQDCFGNTVVGMYNDGGITGPTISVKSTAATPRLMVHVINPVNHIPAAATSDTSTGAGEAYIRIDQADKNVSGLYDGKPHISVYEGGAERTFVLHNVSTERNSSAFVVEATTGLTGANPIGIKSAVTFPETATGSMTGFRSEVTGVAGAAPYVTGIISLFRAPNPTKGTSQTITNLYGYRADGLSVGGTNYGFWSNVDGAGNWGFYANGDAPNLFAGQVESIGTYNATTASAANVNIASNGKIARSTSSRKYKKNIEDLDKSAASDLLDGLRPVWYRSKADADDATWGYYGFIAEEVSELDKRLVHWGKPSKSVKDANGDTTIIEDADAPLEEEGVQYDRIVVMLVSVIKEQKKELAKLKKFVGMK